MPLEAGPVGIRLRLALVGSIILFGAAVVACDHSPAMESEPPRSETPHNPAPPIQLTYNPGVDIDPVVVGGAAFYSFAKGTVDGDVCIGVLPVSGGTREAEICALGSGSEDSTDAYRQAAPLSTDSLAWYRTSRLIGAVGDREQMLVLGSRVPPATFRVLQTFPATGTNGRLYIEPRSLHPTGDGRLAYIGTVLLSYLPCGFCNEEVYQIGRDIITLDPAAPPGQPSPLSDTDYATGTSPGPAPGDVVFTLPGSSRVLQRSASGTVSVLHDFGAGRIIRDARRAGNRLFAIVGGGVDTVTSTTGEPIQRDRGGQLVMVELGNTAEQVTSDLSLKRRPAPTPDGRQVVVEGIPYRPDSLFGPAGVLISVDTVLLSQGDLFRYDLP